MLNLNYYYFLLAIIMMGSVGMFATDIYLPALPSMTVYFNCSQTEIQVSFTVFLLGLASCQLLAGMLADKFGRKKVAITGFLLFTTASLLCAYANTLSQLIVLRLFQAAGAGVGSVLSRALVVDRYDRKQAVKIFSTTFPIIGLSAAVGPLIGGYLTYFWGWRAPFFFITIYGLIMLLFACFGLSNKQESVQNKNDETKQVKTYRIQNYWSVICNPEFLGYALIICASFCVFRSYTVESPFVFSRQGYAAEEMGHFYIGLSIAYILGNLLAKKLINTRSMEKVLRVGMSIFVFGGLCMIGASLIFEESAYAIILPMSIITLGNGFLFPVSSAGAMTSVRSEISGTASGLIGAIQFVLAAFCTNWIGEVCHGKAFPMSIFIAAIVLVGLCSYFWLVMYKPKTQVTAT